MLLTSAALDAGSVQRGKAVFRRVDVKSRGMGQRLQGSKVALRRSQPHGPSEQGVAFPSCSPLLEGVISHVDRPEKDVAQENSQPHPVHAGLRGDERQHRKKLIWVVG